MAAVVAALAVALLLATHALCFAAGKWHLRWTAYRHQVRATETAITDPAHLAASVAWHRRRLPRVFRLHLPRPHLGRRAA